MILYFILLKWPKVLSPQNQVDKLKKSFLSNDTIKSGIKESSKNINSWQYIQPILYNGHLEKDNIWTWKMFKSLCDQDDHGQCRWWIGKPVFNSFTIICHAFKLPWGFIQFFYIVTNKPGTQFIIYYMRNCEIFWRVMGSVGDEFEKFFPHHLTYIQASLGFQSKFLHF